MKKHFEMRIEIKHDVEEEFNLYGIGPQIMNIIRSFISSVFESSIGAFCEEFPGEDLEIDNLQLYNDLVEVNTITVIADITGEPEQIAKMEALLEPDKVVKHFHEECIDKLNQELGEVSTIGLVTASIHDENKLDFIFPIGNQIQEDLDFTGDAITKAIKGEAFEVYPDF